MVPRSVYSTTPDRFSVLKQSAKVYHVGQSFIDSYKWSSYLIPFTSDPTRTPQQSHVKQQLPVTPGNAYERASRASRASRFLRRVAFTASLELESCLTTSSGMRFAPVLAVLP